MLLATGFFFFLNDQNDEHEINTKILSELKILFPYIYIYIFL